MVVRAASDIIIRVLILQMGRGLGVNRIPHVSLNLAGWSVKR